MLFHGYWKNLYHRTMELAYAKARAEITTAIQNTDGNVLDCGAYDGYMFYQLRDEAGLNQERYHGIEWSQGAVDQGKAKGLSVIRGDLNDPMPYEDGAFSICYGLSVIEHLVRPCFWIRECHRLLETDGMLVILTPNISNYFTAAQILFGRMPSSGPYPDSNFLVGKELLMNVKETANDIEDVNPVHRHHIIFSYKVLEKYLKHIGFRQVDGYGFGVYPFPPFLQPFFEKVDKMHCHQMVFVCRK